MTTTQTPQPFRVAPDHGDGVGLELEWCGPAEGGRARLDPRRSLVGIGTPASGKTCLTRLLARRLLDHGGQVVAVDAGTSEYVEAPGPARHSRVVDPMAGTTLDPLRLFVGRSAVEHATAVFTMLAGLSDVDWYARTATALAVGIGDAVDHGARSLVEAAQALEASADPGTSQVGAQVGALLGSGLLPFLGGDGELPAVDADYVCLWLQPAWPGQPLRDEVLAYLAVALGRSGVAADTGRPAALVLDSLPVSSTTAGVVTRALREGRVRNAVTWLLAPRLDAVPSGLVDTFVSLGANRLVLRSSCDEWLALARFVGLDQWLAEELARAGQHDDDGVDEAELCRAMRSLEARGRALWRDRDGRVGLVQLPDAGSLRDRP